MQLRPRMVARQIGETPAVLEHDLSACARYHVMAAYYHKGRRRRFDQSLQAIPAGRGNAAQFVRRIQNKIENYQREIAVTQKKIGGFDGFTCLLATDPEQMLQSAGIVNIERIPSVDEREEKTIALRNLEQAVNEEARAGTQIRTDDFRDCAFAQTALKRLLKQRNVDLSASESRRLLEAFCEKLAEIDDALGRRHTSAWHEALICSSEQFWLRVEGLERGRAESSRFAYRFNRPPLGWWRISETMTPWIRRSWAGR